MRDFNRLYSNCYKFMTSKKNDVELMEISKQIRLRSKADGFTDDEINEQMRKARENRDEANASNQQPSVGAPEEKPPAAPKEEVQQLQQLPEQVSRRTRQSYEAPANLTASGTRKSGASGGKSIVDGIL